MKDCEDSWMMEDTPPVRLRWSLSRCIAQLEPVHHAGWQGDLVYLQLELARA